VPKKREAEATTASGKMSRKEFEKELAKLQVELVRLQSWVQAKRARVIVIFEGRDTAGKGGVISRITACASPRVYRHVALPVPSDREKTQVYIQRYITHFPAAGEIILFDRSWYNRAGVERVMGYCTDEEYERFLAVTLAVEREIAVNIAAVRPARLRCGIVRALGRPADYGAMDRYHASKSCLTTSRKKLRRLWLRGWSGRCCPSPIARQG
jgi:polyphosphate kinase 2 (PPK2 family)